MQAATESTLKQWRNKEMHRIVGDVQKLMGLLDVDRRSIKNCSRIAKLLYDLLNGSQQQNNASATVKQKRQETSGQLPYSIPVSWTVEHKNALEILVNRTTTPHILAHPQYNDPVIAHTGASHN